VPYFILEKLKKKQIMIQLKRKMRKAIDERDKDAQEMTSQIKQAVD
jgi:hypothetical protein